MSYNIAEAKAQFSELIGRAEAGETVEITRRGRPVARLMPAIAPRPPIDLAQLRALTDSLPPQRQTAQELIRELRDAARY
ncbi:type II toxin-antitoxin system Phd/YefM family antitoxin [uncultured Sphingomonas sp.]|uniref:type II toxin-antitoxin system Phd/YefM family antitoxin n=1 Tax=uncultured Sphingomonas sp. TaxID=158754 RepID=UPI0035CC65BD